MAVLREHLRQGTLAEIRGDLDHVLGLPDLLDAPGLRHRRGRVVDLDEPHLGVLRREPEAEGVEAGAQDEHLSRALLDRGLHLLVHEHLAMPEALPLPGHHAVLELVHADHPALLGHPRETWPVAGRAGRKEEAFGDRHEVGRKPLRPVVLHTQRDETERHLERRLTGASLLHEDLRGACRADGLCRRVTPQWVSAHYMRDHGHP